MKLEEVDKKLQILLYKEIKKTKLLEGMISLGFNNLLRLNGNH